MEKKLYQIYDLASRYICGDDTALHTEIIGLAAQLAYEESLPNELKELFGRCLCYTNKDFEKPMTFAEYVSLGEELIEELSGFLGEHFA